MALAAEKKAYSLAVENQLSNVRFINSDNGRKKKKFCPFLSIESYLLITILKYPDIFSTFY